MRRTGRLLSSLLAMITVLAAVAAVGFLVVAPRVVGGATLTVLTGSMSPTIPTGSVVLIQPVEDLEAIEPGTVITFQTSPTERTLVTHRVVRFQPDTEPPTYITKGDANRGEDVDPVPIGAIRGEVIAHVPYLGQVSAYLGGTRGPFLLAAALVALFIAGQAKRIIGALRDDDTDGSDGADPAPALDDLPSGTDADTPVAPAAEGPPAPEPISRLARRDREPSGRW